MRRALPLLIALAVLLCGLHIGESDRAHPLAAHQQLDGDAAIPGDDGDTGPGHPAKTADAGHHHCPVAPDQAIAPALCRAMPRAIPTAQPAAPLASLAQAPPIEPPAA